MKKQILPLLLITTLTTTFFGVHADGSPGSWQDHWWLEKASRALRGGDPLATTENADALLAQGKEKTVESFLSDPRFGDTVLDFSLMFLGFRLDRIKKEKGNYVQAVYLYPQAIHASREVLNDGDFLSIFDLNQPLYVAPLTRPDSDKPADAALSDIALRNKFLQETQDDLDRLIGLAPNVTHETASKFCSELETHVDTYLFNNPAGIPLFTFPEVNTAILSTDWYGLVWNYCQNEDFPASFDLVGALKKAKAKNALLFAQTQNFDSSTYLPMRVDAIQPLNMAALNANYQFNQFKRPLFNALPNSSTNYNRRRSAYVLKRFFCDDLNAIGVDFPAVHAANKHASDPSCFACHYKLDPMAGFFRNYGARFFDYSQSKRIQFDDRARIDRKLYEQSWADGPDAEHPLNVGYIRSTKDLTQNFYGSSLEDLYAYLKVAPEVRRCIMKRAYEYLNSDDQSVDGDYLDYLTDQFNQDIALQGSSGIALKNAFARIVLGPGFSTPNADPNTCYDHKPGYVPSSGVPCQVSSILNKSCVSCHGSTQDSSGLDLAHWETSKDGHGGFPHVDAHGVAISHEQTLQMMLDRLNTTDADMRMPYLKEMLTADRQQLYLWVNQELKQEQPQKQGASK
jgi:hypothetical protein